MGCDSPHARGNDNGAVGVGQPGFCGRGMYMDN